MKGCAKDPAMTTRRMRMIRREEAVSLREGRSQEKSRKELSREDDGEKKGEAFIDVNQRRNAADG